MPNKSGRVSKRRRRGNDVQSPTTSTVALPSTRLVKMRYASYKSLAGTTGTVSTQIVGCGDLHDPDKTGVGHQPLGYDQWTSFYGAYVVLRSRIQAWFAYNQSQAASTQPVCGIFRDNTSAPVSLTWPHLVEQGRSVHALGPATLSYKPIYLTLDYDAKRDFNVRDVADNETRIGALFGASPTEGMFFDLWAGSIDESSTCATIVMYVVDYEVLVSQPKELAQS